MNDTYKPNLEPTRLETSRTEFASWVTTIAAQCANNSELLTRLRNGLPSGFLAEVGEGSTRRVYSCPLGVCVKMQREDVISDPLSEAELQERGGDSYLPELGWRRRKANLSEIIYAAVQPLLMPRQYAFLGSFGIAQSHPSILIAETARPLDRYFPHDGKAILTTDMGINQDGKLCIYDDRVTPLKRPHDLIPFERLAGVNEPEIWLGNIGVTTAGEFVFVDRSDHGDVSTLLNELTLAPYEWGWTFRGSPEKNTAFSNDLFSRYKSAWERKGYPNG